MIDLSYDCSVCNKYAIEDDRRTATSGSVEEAKVQRKSTTNIEWEIKIEDNRWGYQCCDHRFPLFDQEKNVSTFYGNSIQHFLLVISISNLF
jgi:hypothetical protein